MNVWSKRFNALPDETRCIAAAVIRESNIQFLKFERERLGKRHRQSLKEIDDHIKNLEASITDITKPREWELGDSEG